MMKNIRKDRSLIINRICIPDFSVKTLFETFLEKKLSLLQIEFQLIDTGEDSKLIDGRKRPKVDASIFFFSDASERRV